MYGSPTPDRTVQAVDRRHKLWGWILGGCVGILGIGAIIVILAMLLFARGGSEFTPHVDELLALVDEGKYDDAYNSLGDGWKATQTMEEFQGFFVIVREALGLHETVRMTSVHYEKNLGSPPRARAVFVARFQKSKAALNVTFQKYGSSWKIDGLHLDSDALVSELTCPHCGTVNNWDANHCSSCGVKIKRPVDAEEHRQRESS